MREILFKAKSIVDGEWYKGGIFICGENAYMHTIIEDDEVENVESGMYIIPVDINTVCQFTGLHDAKGNKIWENDIVKMVNEETSIPAPYIRYTYGDIAKIKCLASGFTMCRPLNDSDIPNTIGNVDNYKLWNYQGWIEVIGNTFDNPELLESKV